MFCCPNCFNLARHSYLKSHIETYSNEIGECSFCSSSNNVPIIEANELMDLFQPVIDLYRISKDGILLVDILQEDWNIFSEKISNDRKKVMLSEIMGDKTFEEMKVDASCRSQENQYIKKWGDFTKELQHKNRFFPTQAIDENEFQKILNYLVVDNTQIPEFIFRARLNSKDSPYCISDMGKPPEEKAPDGRANPKGISYFYGASDEITAISETRPYKSEIVYVASFKLNSKAKLIDLRNPRETISPFGREEGALSLIFTEISFLTHLSEALSIPVLPDKKDYEYLPTQYLCEQIKKIGYSGITFKSSLGDGDNYVIFDDTFLIGQSVEVYQNENIEIKPIKVNI